MLSKPKIIKTIRDIHRLGESLNITAVKRRHPKLIQAVYAVQPFWGWKQALKDAGIDYANIKIELQETIKCELCGKYFRNLGNHLIMKHEVKPDEYLMDYPESDLVCEEIRANHLQKKIPLIHHWEPCLSQEYVLDRVAEYYRQNYPMHTSKFEDIDNSLVMAATKYWGGWKEALIAVGLDPRKVTQEGYRQLRKYPDKEAAILGIKRRLKRGLSVYAASLKKKHGKIRSDIGLFHAGAEYFGSWRNALTAAGVDLKEAFKRKKKYPTKNEIINEIRARHKRKWDINHGELFHGTHQDAALGIGARKCFGSWREALKAAGFEPIKVYRQAWLRHLRYPDSKSVLKAIKRRLQKGRFVNYNKVVSGNDRDLPLWWMAKKLFGSWKNALKEAGLDPSKIEYDARSRAVRKRC